MKKNGSIGSIESTESIEPAAVALPSSPEGWGFPDGCTFEFLPRRGITKETHEFFNVRTRIGPDGQPLVVEYRWSNGAVQYRWIGEKKFRVQGPYSEAGGWGRDFFPAGSAKMITITEGLDDAMAAWQMLGRHPVYAVKSVATAVSDCKKDFDYLNSFERIYLTLDSDKPGQDASKKIAKLFDFNKVYHVKLAPLKDACEYLEQGKEKEFKNVWWNSSRFLPEGIISSWEQIDEVIDKENSEAGLPWPFKRLQYLTGGIKPSTTYLITGLEGIGKTEFFHAIEYHLAVTDPDANIGIIHIEERQSDNIKKLVGYHIRKPILLEEYAIPPEEVKRLYREVSRRPDRLHFYKHFGSNDPEVILTVIRCMAAAVKCKYIFLDNITMVVTGLNTEDERKELDYISTRLEMMVKELGFTLFLISHENDLEQTRGSRNISKVADVWINMKRDIKEANEFKRNSLYLTLNKGRGCRGTGPAGVLYYNPDRGVLEELEDELPV